MARRRVGRMSDKSVNSSSGLGNNLKVIAIRLDFDVFSASFAARDHIRFQKTGLAPSDRPASDRGASDSNSQQNLRSAGLKLGVPGHIPRDKRPMLVF